MKKVIIIMFVLFVQNIHAQNVGIGTTTPQTNLHVSSTGSTIIRNESLTGTEASLELKTSGPFFDFLELRKWKTGAAGSVASIPLDGLSTITTGSFTTGGLLIGTKPAQPVYFTSNNIERMRLDANGNLGINTTNPSYALQVTANNKYGIFTTASVNGTDTIAGIYGLAQSPTPVPFSAGVRGESNSTNYNGIGVLGLQRGSGWGVAGFIKEEGVSGLGYAAGVFGAAGYPLTGGGTGGFGVYGVNNNNGGTAGFFQDIFGSATSLALRTSGKLRFNGIGEANGKVLTSDASGNATWTSLPGGATVWGVSGNNIYNTNTGYVGIGTSNPQYLLHLEPGAHNGIYARSTITNNDSAAIIGVLDVPTGVGFRAAAVRGESKSTTSNSIGVYGLQNGGGWGVAGSVKEAGLFGWGAGVYGEAGLNGIPSGTGGYGVYGANNNTGGTGGYFENNSSSTTSYALHAKTGVTNTAAAWLEGNSGAGIAVEIDGAIKVNTTATNRPTFTHVTAAANIISNYSTITYPNPLSTDFVMVIPNYTAGPVYNAHPIGVFFTAGKWAVFNQDLATMPVGVAYNVLVIRQ